MPPESETSAPFLQTPLLVLALVAIAGAGGYFAYTSLSASHLAVAPTSQAASPSFSLPSGVNDTITITNASGVAQTNYPYQFGRPFVQGEIPHYPQVLINGTPVQTQADVKNRYPDGSVKFAVISVVVPSIPVSGATTLSFKDQPTGNNSPLSSAQMLAPNFDFDAAIKLSQGSATQSASARTMLQNGDYTYWASGPVATTIVLKDDSAARKYDMGFDSLKSIRPVFEATFWPALNKVEVRVIGEDEDTQTLEDVTANLTITTGSATPQTVYTKSNLTTYAATAWNKTYWLGGAPEEKIDIDNNVAYLAATQFVPNYDPSLESTFTDSYIAPVYSAWLAKPKDLYQAGDWTQYMPTTGSRGDIGVEPSWMARWLYTGDWRLREIALSQADLADAWPLQFVEGSSAKQYNAGQSIPAIGLPISIYAHPTLQLYDANGGFNAQNSSDAVAIAGMRAAKSPWINDVAHQPDPFSVPYMLTGDPFYLSELQDWAATSALSATICNTPSSNCGSDRSSSPVIAGIHDQVRADGWTIRTRARAGFFSPDGTPEQSYFSAITDDALALWEGERGISDPVLGNTLAWTRGNTIYNFTPSPLHFFGQGMSAAQTGINTNFVHGNVPVEALWQDYYFLDSLGNVKEMGYPAGSLLTWFGKVLTGQVAEFPPAGTYTPKLVATYYSPLSAGMSAPDFSTWGQVQAELTPADVTTTINNFGTGSYYPALAASAGSFLTNDPGGAAAWSWLSANARPTYDYRAEPGWDILPRSISVIPLPPPPVATTTPATSTPPVATSTPPVATSTKPVGTTTVTIPTTPSNLPPATSANTLLGTAGNDTLTVISGIHYVNGQGGNDTVKLAVPGSTSENQYSVTHNSDGTVTVKDTHSTGYTISLTGIATLVFPDKETLALLPAGTVVPPPNSTVSITSIQVTGAIASVPNTAFTYSGGTCAGGTFSVGQSCTVLVTFAPPQQGQYVASLSVVDSSKATHFIALGGIGTVPVPVVPPVVSNLPAPTTANTLVGTAGNDSLTAVSGIHYVNGEGGSDTVTLAVPGSTEENQYSVVHNTDGTVTVKDTHSTGYTMLLTGISTLVFPDKETLQLSTALVLPPATPKPVTTTPTPVAVTPAPAPPTVPAGSLLGTSGNDTLTETDGIHYINGEGGTDTAKLTMPSGARMNWYTVTHNSDGSITVKDVHATGYSVTLVGIHTVIFPDGETLQLSSIAMSGFFERIALGFQSMGRSLRIAFAGASEELALLATGQLNEAAVGLSLSTTIVSFGSVPVGGSAVQTITISFTQNGITGAAGN